MSVDPGLCARCRHAHAITSGRGSTFWRCKVHDTDPRWPKYPRLPVVQCVRFEVRTAIPVPPSRDP